MTIFALGKRRLRPIFGKHYKHEILNNLFHHPYTKIEFMQAELQFERRTVAKYLDKIVEEGLLSKRKVGRENYYINDALVSLFVSRSSRSGADAPREPR